MPVPKLEIMVNASRVSLFSFLDKKECDYYQLAKFITSLHFLDEVPDFPASGIYSFMNQFDWGKDTEKYLNEIEASAYLDSVISADDAYQLAEYISESSANASSEDEKKLWVDRNAEVSRAFEEYFDSYKTLIRQVAQAREANPHLSDVPMEIGALSELEWLLVETARTFWEECYAVLKATEQNLSNVGWHGSEDSRRIKTFGEGIFLVEDLDGLRMVIFPNEDVLVRVGYDIEYDRVTFRGEFLDDEMSDGYELHIDIQRPEPLRLFK